MSIFLKCFDNLAFLNILLYKHGHGLSVFNFPLPHFVNKLCQTGRILFFSLKFHQSFQVLLENLDILFTESPGEIPFLLSAIFINFNHTDSFAEIRPIAILEGIILEYGLVVRFITGHSVQPGQSFQHLLVELH